MIAELQRCGTQAEVKRIRDAHKSLFAGFVPPADGSGKAGRKTPAFVQELVEATVDWVRTRAPAAQQQQTRAAQLRREASELTGLSFSRVGFDKLVAFVERWATGLTEVEEIVATEVPKIAAMQTAVDQLEQRQQEARQEVQPPALQDGEGWQQAGRKSRAEERQRLEDGERKRQQKDLRIAVKGGPAPPSAERRKVLEQLLHERLQFSSSATQAIMAKVAHVAVHRNRGHGPGYVLMATCTDIATKEEVLRRRNAWRRTGADAASGQAAGPPLHVGHNLTPMQRAQYSLVWDQQQRIYAQGVPVHTVFFPAVCLVVAGRYCKTQEDADRAAAAYLRSRASSGRGSQPSPSNAAGAGPVPSRGQAQAPTEARATRQQRQPPPPPPTAAAATAATPAAPGASYAAAARSAMLPDQPPTAASVTTAAAEAPPAPAAPTTAGAAVQAAPTAAAGTAAAEAPAAAATAATAGPDGRGGGTADAAAATAAARVGSPC